MNECLVTRLKSTVDNPALDYFDALQFRANWKSGFTQVTISSETYGIYVGGIGAVIKVLSNGHIEQGGINKGTEITISENMGNVNLIPDDANSPTDYLVIGLSKITNLYMSATSPIEVRNPDLIKYTQQNSIVWDNVLYFYAPWDENSPASYDFIDELIPNKTAINSFRAYQEYSDYNHLITINTSILKKFTAITNFSFSGYYFRPVGDIANLNVFINTTTLQLRDKGAYGDIASIGSMTSLTFINMNGSIVHGSLNELVENMYANGRKSASASNRIRMYFGSYSDVRLNNVTQSASGYLAWDDGGSAPANIRIETN